MADWPNDKELEEIYRKGSENHDFNYSPEAWKDMERLMDKDNRKKYLLLFMLFLGIALGSYSIYSTSWSKAEKSEIVFGESKINEDIHSKNDIKLSIDKNEYSPVAVESDILNSKNTNGSVLANGSSIDFHNSNSRSKQVDTKKTTSNFYNTNPPSNLSSPFLITKNPYEDVNLSSPVNSNTYSTSTKLTNENQSAANKRRLSSSSDLIKLETLDISLFDISFALQTNTPDRSPIINKTNHYSKFLVAAVIGTESSWTPNGDFSSIDLSLGLRANYFVNNNLSISLGANYINDFYIAEKGDYKTSTEGFWKSQGIPEYTSANCRMIELNTGISYYFNGVNTSGFSANIGVLSNFMLNESYNYHYTEDTNNFSSSWTMANKTWLNGLELGTGYRFNFSKSWVIEAGPYIKVPLSGIGHGNVMLSTIGLRASIGIRTK